jgi:hypothetical protein
VFRVLWKENGFHQQTIAGFWNREEAIKSESMSQRCYSRIEVKVFWESSGVLMVWKSRGIGDEDGSTCAFLIRGQATSSKIGRRKVEG